MNRKTPSAMQLAANKEDSRDIIVQHLQNGGETELSQKQEEMLERWEFAHEKIREGMGLYTREKIAQMIAEEFAVSLITARNDMVNAEYVFSSSSPLNKKHRILLRIEYLEQQSREAAEAGDHKAVGMIEKAIAAYILNYPDTAVAKPRRQVVFNIQQNFIQNDVMPNEQAENILELAAKEIIEE